MDLQPPLKRFKGQGNCIFCDRTLPEKGIDIVRNPTVDGLKVIFEAADIRKDVVYYSISPLMGDILSGAVSVAYHKSCHSSYTSTTNLKYVQCGVLSNYTSNVSNSIGSNPHLSRRETTTFNVRCDCFICGKEWKRGEKLIQISKGTGQSTREKVLHAASERKDEVVFLQMINHEDLFAVEAKYHRSCYSAYISQRNISAAKHKVSPSNFESTYDKVFKEVLTEIEMTILSPKKTVTTLTQITSDFSKNCQDME
jgi:hypothetical protein